jgi:CheY-like chemotaxis protein
MSSILIIDDDRLVRETTAILLRNKGHQVSVAENGRAGIEAARGGAFDIAIVDLFMPDMDGMQVMKAVREQDPNILMIAASGFMFNGNCPSMPGFKDMAAEAGAVATLYKPFRPHDVIHAVETALATRRDSVVYFNAG